MAKKKHLDISSRHTRSLSIVTLIAILTGIWLVSDYITVIIVSVIFAFMFAPTYRRINRKVKKPSMAASLTLGAAFITIIVPLTAILAITIAQIRTFSTDVSRLLDNEYYRELPSNLIERVNTLSNSFTGGTVDISREQLTEYASQVGSAFASTMLDLMSGWFTGATELITTIVLFVYLFLGILTHQKELLQLLKRLNPLDDKTLDLYLTKAGAMTQGMVRGQFIIALAQGATGALTLYIAQIPYVAFLFLLLSFLSLIPLGGGILSIPIGIILLVTGNIWQGLVVLLGHFLIVVNIDNVLRPILVPKRAYLHPALTMLGVFAGLSLFGFLGIIIGPVLMILIVTTLDVYATYRSPATGSDTASA